MSELATEFLSGRFANPALPVKRSSAAMHVGVVPSGGAVLHPPQYHLTSI